MNLLLVVNLCVSWRNCELVELWLISPTPQVPLSCASSLHLIPASNREPNSTNRTGTKGGKRAELAILRTWLQQCWLGSIPSYTWLLARLNTLASVKSLSRVWLFVTLWTVARQGSQSMGFSRQEYWSGLPCPSQEDLPDPGIKPRSPALQADSLLFEPRGEQFLLKKQQQQQLLKFSLRQ